MPSSNQWYYTLKRGLFLDFCFCCRTFTTWTTYYHSFCCSPASLSRKSIIPHLSHRCGRNTWVPELSPSLKGFRGFHVTGEVLLRNRFLIAIVTTHFLLFNVVDRLLKRPKYLSDTFCSVNFQSVFWQFHVTAAEWRCSSFEGRW